MVFCNFYPARATLCGDRRGRGAKTHGFLQKLKVFCDFCCSNWLSGVVSWFARLLPEPAVAGSIPPWSAGGAARCNLHFTATCAEQLAQSKLHRATCADQLAPTSLRRAPCLEQLAQSNLRRATCTEQLAQSSLHRATCRERNLHRATCRDQLAGATCAEQLAQSNLHSATCAEQLAQTNLHRPVCAEHLAWCCLALASRSVGKKNASCSVGPTSLAMFCFRANRGLVTSKLFQFEILSVCTNIFQKVFFNLKSFGIKVYLFQTFFKALLAHSFLAQTTDSQLPSCSNLKLGWLRRS